jgi:hypothetical protein
MKENRRTDGLVAALGELQRSLEKLAGVRIIVGPFEQDAPVHQRMQPSGRVFRSDGQSLFRYSHRHQARFGGDPAQVPFGKRSHPRGQF